MFVLRHSFQFRFHFVESAGFVQFAQGNILRIKVHRIVLHFRFLLNSSFCDKGYSIEADDNQEGGSHECLQQCHGLVCLGLLLFAAESSAAFVVRVSRGTIPIGDGER